MAYSPSFKKCVFIDFGLSSLIKEELGYKTFTHFLGTLSYSSDEMKKAYYLNKPKLIDLYHNDSVGLKITLDKIKFLFDHSKNEEKEEKDEYSNQSKI